MSKIQIEVKGVAISASKKSFKNSKGEEIEYHDITLSNPDSNKKMITLTMKEDVYNSILDPEDIAGKTVVLFGTLTDQNSKYTVSIDGKEKILWVNKPRLVIDDSITIVDDHN